MTYIHDLPASVCPQDPLTRDYAVFFINQIIRCLLWADDLLLFGLQPEHVQRQLNALAEYCVLNKLRANKKKTQVMFVSTRGDLSLNNQHIFTYMGTPLENVSLYKYLGVWLDNKGSCDVQAKELLAKANHAMFACMSKSRQLSTCCPTSLRVLLFKSYVLPILTYACEVLPYGRHHIKSMNNIIMKFAKWATGLPSHTCHNAVLREANMRPVQYEFLQARMSYYILILSRDASHVTRQALADLQHRRSTSLYFRWYCGITACFDNLDCQHLIDNPMYGHSTKHIIKKVVQQTWLSEGGAPLKEIEDNTMFSYHLRGIRATDPCFDTVKCARINVLASSVSRIAIRTQVVDRYKYGGAGYTHLNTTRIKRYEQEALSLFRTGVAPCFVNRQMGTEDRSSNRLHRVCAFCKHMYGLSFLNDVNHVLFICPLVAKQRKEMWLKLHGVCGASEWIPVESVSELAIALLSPHTTELACTVGCFLAEYLGAMELYRIASSGLDMNMCLPKWFGGKKSLLSSIKVDIQGLLHDLSSVRAFGSNEVLPFPSCNVTNTWISILVHEKLDDAFKFIRLWLPDGWANNIEPSRIRHKKSIALF